MIAGGIKVTCTPTSGAAFALDSAEIYDTDTGSWSMAGDLDSHRSGHTATLLQNGMVLIAGGTNSAVNGSELYDPNKPITLPKIIGVSGAGKKLFVFGEGFSFGSIILLNGEDQRTINDGQNPKNALIAKKAGKKIKPGDKMQVRNRNGTLSPEFIFPD